MEKTREARTTKKQLDLMVDYISVNKIIINHSKEINDLKVYEEKWNELVETLNSSGLGPIKSKTQWKRVLTEFKTNTRRKYQELKKEQERTGGGENKKKPLTDTENRLIALQSKVALDGLEIEEAGLPEEQLIAEIEVDNVFENPLQIVATEPEDIENAVIIATEFIQLPENITQQSITAQTKHTIIRNRRRKRKANNLEGIIKEYKEIASQQNEVQKVLTRALDNISNLPVFRRRRLICKPVPLPFI